MGVWWVELQSCGRAMGGVQSYGCGERSFRAVVVVIGASELWVCDGRSFRAVDVMGGALEL